MGTVELKQGDIVEHEGEEWKVFWKPSSAGQVELQGMERISKSTVAWVSDVKFIRSSDPEMGT